MPANAISCGSQLRKLRYAVDFFGWLFPGHKAKKRLSTFQGSLKNLQNHLGALNDIQVHQKPVRMLTSGKPRTEDRQRAYAAGVVSRREQSEIEPCEALGTSRRKKSSVARTWEVRLK
jgi:CHAD domain-containing protein